MAHEVIYHILCSCYIYMISVYNKLQTNAWILGATKSVLYIEFVLGSSVYLLFYTFFTVINI
jgi:hypothetical protein